MNDDNDYIVMNFNQKGKPYAIIKIKKKESLWFLNESFKGNDMAIELSYT